MSITDFKKIDNSLLYSDYAKYEYKFGDLDLMSGGGLLGNSVMNFGLFYYDIEDFIKAQDEARFLFKLKSDIVGGGSSNVLDSESSTPEEPTPTGEPTPTYEIPETILFINGEAWNGSTTAGDYIGPSITESGTVSVSFVLGKDAIITNNINEYLRFDDTISNEPSNYVVFLIGRTVASLITDTGYAMYGIDMRKDDSSYTRLRFPICWVGGPRQHIYSYGISGTTDVSVTLSSSADGIYDTRINNIRCLILQNETGKLFIKGDLILTGGWIPCELGGAGHFNRINQSSSTVRQALLSHLSVHKFSSTGQVDQDWVNNYANSLTAYYTGLTWNNVTLYD